MRNSNIALKNQIQFQYRTVSHSPIRTTLRLDQSEIMKLEKVSMRFLTDLSKTSTGFMMNYYFYELPKSQNRRKDREHGSTDIGANWIINDYTNFSLANRIFAENKGIANALSKQDRYYSP